MLHELDRGPAALQKRLQQRGVAFVNLSRFKLLSRYHELVPGGDNRGCHLAADHHLNKALGREQGECSCTKAFACVHDSLAFAQIAAARPNEFARIDIYIQDDLVSIACYIFLHDDRIRSSRHWSTSENPHRFSRRSSNLPIRAVR